MRRGQENIRELDEWTEVNDTADVAKTTRGSAGWTAWRMVMRKGRY